VKVKVIGKTKALHLPAFKFSINNVIFPAMFDTGSMWNTISHELAQEIEIEQFPEAPTRYSSDGNYMVGYLCPVTLGVGTIDLEIYPNDDPRFDNLSVKNVISALDYLKNCWYFTFCDQGAEFQSKKRC